MEFGVSQKIHRPKSMCLRFEIQYASSHFVTSAVWNWKYGIRCYVEIGSSFDWIIRLALSGATVITNTSWMTQTQVIYSCSYVYKLYARTHASSSSVWKYIDRYTCECVCELVHESLLWGYYVITVSTSTWRQWYIARLHRRRGKRRETCHPIYWAVWFDRPRRARLPDEFAALAIHQPPYISDSVFISNSYLESRCSKAKYIYVSCVNACGYQDSVEQATSGFEQFFKIVSTILYSQRFQIFYRITYFFLFFPFDYDYSQIREPKNWK